MYQKLDKWFIDYKPINKIQNVFKEEELNLIIDEVINHENFEKIETEMETYKSIEELKYPPEHNSNSPIVIVLDDLNEKERNVLRVQAMFKRSRHNNFSIFIINQEYYKLPKRTVRANGW